MTRDDRRRARASWQSCTDAIMTSMRAVIAGGSGFLGRALAARLGASGWSVHVLTRRPRPGVSSDVAWTPNGDTGPWAAAIDAANVVINLAGENIADKRWSEARKRVLRESRLQATRSLALAVQRAGTPPGAFISASGVNYYGPHGEEPLAEDAPPGSDFLATLVADWEREAERAAAVTRVALVRSGAVLHPSGGALAKMLTPFKWGVGGRVASGRQYVSWIHIDDWLRLVEWMAGEPRAAGAFNATAPGPVTNAEFTRALGQALKRPAVIPVPAVALRVMFGELADMLVTGQRALPMHAERLGFDFRFRQIQTALNDLL